jgi:hypothetical protein
MIASNANNKKINVNEFITAFNKGSCVTQNGISPKYPGMPDSTTIRKLITIVNTMTVLTWCLTIVCQTLLIILIPFSNDRSSINIHYCIVK